MKTLIYLILLILPGTLLGQAQIEEVLLQQLNSSVGPSVQNTLLIQQEGLYHQAEVQQVASQNSQINVTQYGEAHILKACQEGTDNEWKIQQTGRQHYFIGNLSGDGNRVQVHQNGMQNTLYQDLIGNGLEYTVSQEGQNLELIQIEHTSLAPAYQLQQRGVNMKVIIEQGFQ